MQDQSRPDVSVHTSPILLPMLLVLAMVGELSVGVFVPVTPQLKSIFLADASRVQLTISFFAAGFALGQLLYGPLSDRLGRRPVLLTGLCIYLAGSLLAVLSPSLDLLVGARLVQGLGASACLSLARAMVRDVYGQENSARVMAVLFFAVSSAILVGPVIGGVMADHLGWTASLYFLVGLGTVMLLTIALLLPETNPHRSAGGSSLWAAIAGYPGLFTSTNFRSYACAHACAYASMYAWISGAPFVLIEQYAYTRETYGVLFAASFTGMPLGVMVARHYVRRFGMPRLALTGLVIAACPALLLTGLSLLAPPSIWVLIGLQFLYMFGIGVMSPNTTAGALIDVAKSAGAASAMFGFLHVAAASIAVLVLGQIQGDTGTPVYALQTALIALAIGGFIAIRRSGT